MRIKFIQEIIDKLRGKEGRKNMQAAIEKQAEAIHDICSKLNKSVNDIKSNILMLNTQYNSVVKEISELKNMLQPQPQTPTFANFLNIKIPPEHKILEYMTLYKYYDRCLPRILNVISKEYEDFKLIDVGANIGDTAQGIRLAGLDFPILAIEGDSEYFKYLEENKSVIKNIDTCNAILSDKEETLNFQMNTHDGTGNLVQTEENGCNTIPLDKLLEQFPQYKNSKFLKIDTDGFDNIILKGAKNWLGNAKPIIYMEYDPNFLIKNNDFGLEIFKYLYDLGYKNAIMYQNYGEYMCSFELNNEQFISEMRDFFYKNYRIYYADLLIFNEKDNDMFSKIREFERNYFRIEKN